MILDAFTDEGAGRGSGEPRPLFSAYNSADMADADVKFGGKKRSTFSLRSPMAYFSNVKFGELGLSRPDSTSAGAVRYRVAHVLQVSFPRKMARIHASEVSISARVRRFMLWRWGIAVNYRAHDARNLAIAPSVVSERIAELASMERPNQTLVSRKLDCNIVYVGSQRSTFGAPTRNIGSPVASHARRVFVAQTMRMDWLVASLNRAYWFLSHATSSFLAWLERRVERCNAPRPSFISTRSA